MTHLNDTNTIIKKPQGMKFFKFYTWVSLPLSALISVIYGINYLSTGFMRADTYNMIIGLTYIPMACTSIYGAINLKKFTATAYAINKYSLIYIAVLNTILYAIVAFLGDYITSLTGFLFVIIYYPLVLVYFHKRKHLFFK